MSVGANRELVSSVIRVVANRDNRRQLLLARYVSICHFLVVRLTNSSHRQGTVKAGCLEPLNHLRSVILTLTSAVCKTRCLMGMFHCHLHEIMTASEKPMVDFCTGSRQCIGIVLEG